MGGGDGEHWSNGGQEGLLSTVTTLSLFHDLVQLEIRGLSEGELLQRAAEAMLSVPSAEVCVIHKQSVDGLEPGPWAGWRDLLQPDVETADDGFEQRLIVLTEGYARVAASEIRVVHLPDLGLSKGPADSHNGSLLCAPIACGESSLGVLCVAHSRVGRYGPWDERLVAHCADLIGQKWLLHRLQSVGPATPHLAPRPVPEVRDLRAAGASDVTDFPAETFQVLCAREAFDQSLAAALADGSKGLCYHALCHLDVDQVCVIRSACGRAAAEELVRQVVLQIRSRLRTDDVMVRLGPDEFGILLRDCPSESAVQVAESLRQVVRDIRFLWEGSRFRVSTSVGVISFTGSDRNPSELLRAAEVACVAAKERGRNFAQVYLEDDQELLTRARDMQWVVRLNQALEEDRLTLAYQPICPISSPYCDDSPELIELLVRLREPDGRLVMPGEFLPAAERYGLAPQVDRWVLRNAVEWLVKLREAGNELPCCAINLSGNTIGDQDYLVYAVRVIRDSGLPGDRVLFEITETAAIANLQMALRSIEALGALGCRFALDDFGAGLSSFGYLKSLPVELLKIDGAFTRELDSDPRSIALVRAINEMGQVLGKRTVAECVETQRDLATLSAIGVDFVQGYLLGRPKPLEQWGRNEVGLTQPLNK